MNNQLIFNFFYSNAPKLFY